jgi:hypothetical protein
LSNESGISHGLPLFKWLSTHLFLHLLKRLSTIPSLPIVYWNRYAFPPTCNASEGNVFVIFTPFFPPFFGITGALNQAPNSTRRSRGFASTPCRKSVGAAHSEATQGSARELKSQAPQASYQHRQHPRHACRHPEASDSHFHAPLNPHRPKIAPSFMGNNCREIGRGTRRPCRRGLGCPSRHACLLAVCVQKIQTVALK